MVILKLPTERTWKEAWVMRKSESVNFPKAFTNRNWYHKSRHWRFIHVFFFSFFQVLFQWGIQFWMNSSKSVILYKRKSCRKLQEASCPWHNLSSPGGGGVLCLGQEVGKGCTPVLAGCSNPIPHPTPTGPVTGLGYPLPPYGLTNWKYHLPSYFVCGR